MKLKDFSVDLRATNHGEIKVELALPLAKWTVLRSIENRKPQPIVTNQIKGLKASVFRYDTINATAEVSLLSQFFNMQVGCWEPLIENYKLEIEAIQEKVDDPMVLRIKSDDIFNMNISYQLVLARNQVRNQMMKLKNTIQSKKMEHEIVEEKDIETEYTTANDFSYAVFNRLGRTIQCWIELPT